MISTNSTLQLSLLFNRQIISGPNRQHNPTPLLILQPTLTVLGFPVGIFSPSNHSTTGYCTINTTPPTPLRNHQNTISSISHQQVHPIKNRAHHCNRITNTNIFVYGRNPELNFDPDKYSKSNLAFGSITS